MSEEKTTTGKSETSNAEGQGERNNPSTTPLIESANSTAERLENATKALKEQNDRREEILARERLGGVTRGAIQEVKPAEIDPREYAKMALEGRIPRK